MPSSRVTHPKVQVGVILDLSFLNFVLIEPVGSKAPVLANDLKIMGYDRQLGQSFALLCPAQGLPLPLFRLVFSIHI